MNKQERQKINSTSLKKFLKPIWETYNVLYFEGALKRCPNFILFENPKFLAAYGFSLSRNNKVSHGKIIFSEKFFYEASSKMFKEALLHEMAHQFVIEILNLPHHGHGPIWRMICKALGIKPQAKTPWRG
jgi:hypothetical protein